MSFQIPEKARRQLEAAGKDIAALSEVPEEPFVVPGQLAIDAADEVPLDALDLVESCIREHGVLEDGDLCRVYPAWAVANGATRLSDRLLRQYRDELAATGRLVRVENGWRASAREGRPTRTDDVATWIGDDDWAGLVRDADILKQRDVTEYGRGRQWNPDRHLIGLMGEFIFARHAGLPFQVDLNQPTRGDGGRDFFGVDVKGNPYPDPWLRRGERDAWKADYYALVKVDLALHNGYVVGWATRDELRGAPTKQMPDGKGGTEPVHVLRPHELRDGLPPMPVPA